MTMGYYKNKVFIVDKHNLTSYDIYFFHDYFTVVETEDEAEFVYNSTDTQVPEKEGKLYFNNGNNRDVEISKAFLLFSTLSWNEAHTFKEKNKKSLVAHYNNGQKKIIKVGETKDPKADKYTEYLPNKVSFKFESSPNSALKILEKTYIVNYFSEEDDKWMFPKTKAEKFWVNHRSFKTNKLLTIISTLLGGIVHSAGSGYYDLDENIFYLQKLYVKDSPETMLKSLEKKNLLERNTPKKNKMTLNKGSVQFDTYSQLLNEIRDSNVWVTNLTE